MVTTRVNRPRTSWRGTYERLANSEFGPLNLIARPGQGWFPRGRPARQRATYTRTAGVRHMFGALDLASGQLFYRFRDRKRWQEFLDFCRQLRRRFPTRAALPGVRQLRLPPQGRGPDVVHRPRHRDGVRPVQRLLAELDRVRVTALRYFTLDGSDYPSHAAQEAAIAGYIRWANKRAKPKRRFAVDSKIRRPDCLPNVA